MQFTTLSVAFFAALATAHAHHPQHFHHRRQLNGTGTSAASGESTTLTIFTTIVHTETSCAPTITDCPAATGGPVVVTDVIAITTTVCPVEQAESASSAAHASYSATAINTAQGGVTTPTIPLTTGGSGPGPAPTSAASGQESVVLTYTLGSGTSTTVVTTTIIHKSTATVYATIPAGVGEAGGAEVTPKQGNADSGVELTTTYTGTSTSTKYITVMAAPSAAEGALGAGASGAGEGGCVPVTVTVAALTVTVTETAVPTPVSAAEGAVSSLPVKNNDVEAPSTTDFPDFPLFTPTGATADSGAATDSPVIILSTRTVMPIPVYTPAPYQNGTVSAGGAATSKTKTKCASSGFVTKAAALPTGY